MTGLSLATTTRETIYELGYKICSSALIDCPDSINRDKVNELFQSLAWQLVLDARVEDEEKQTNVVDPRHLPVNGMNPSYRAWTCATDSSVGL